MRITVPVNIICGALGAGKTTAIAQLLANKPAHESWVVILNEFTDTGIDTLTLAAAARGSYDVRMIPGGCLCCTGEEDFRRQLSGLLASEHLPARIVIEPSGIGHPGAIIEELRVFERSGAIKLSSAVVLIEPQRINELSSMSTLLRDQVDAADVVMLSKAEQAGFAMRERFKQWASELFPAKRYIGISERGILPVQALSPPVARFTFVNEQRLKSHDHSHESPDANIESRTIQIGHETAQAQVQRYLGREACGWLIPATVMFDLQQVARELQQASALNQGAERIKAVLRTGIDHWHLVQRWGNQYAVREIAWRKDSRIEVQMAEGVQSNWSAWDTWLPTIVC